MLYILFAMVIIAMVIIVKLLDAEKLNSTAYTKINPNKLPYKKVSILTDNELIFYKKLKFLTLKYGYELFVKVRLADIITTNNDVKGKEKNAWFAKLRAKHIDFVICDKSTLETKLLIELDDSSHQRADRIKRDAFVDNVCNKVNLQIIHIKNNSIVEIENILNSI